MSLLAPVLNFGSEELKRKIAPPVFAGDKFIALAISEAFAGSDVAGLRTTAVKTPDGKHYIVNGTKARRDSYVRFYISKESSTDLCFPATRNGSVGPHPLHFLAWRASY
jgi:hypothetical protein